MIIVSRWEHQELEDRMQNSRNRVITAVVFTVVCSMNMSVQADHSDQWDGGYGYRGQIASEQVQLGPRPFFLVDDMDEGRLKRRLQRCAKGTFEKSDFSVGHRGGRHAVPGTHQGVLHRSCPHGRRYHRV